MDLKGFEARKRDHLRLALDETNQAAGGNGLDRIRLAHRALPEINFADVRIDTDFFGKSAASPCFISSMTMGHGEGEALNARLASVAAAKDWPMGVGSQRRELTDADSAAEAKRLRKAAPAATLFSNIGLAQLISAKPGEIARIVENLGAVALFVHCNSLQEAIQPEGTPNFAGGIRALAALTQSFATPVIVKETGCGFSAEDFRRLAETGVRAIDVSGYGGTHWGRIEGGRADLGSVRAEAAKTFAFWGEPTLDSLLTARDWQTASGECTEIWASGGIRSGLDAAKCLALGAAKVGFAKPALAAAQAGEASLAAWMECIEFELKVALFCTGSASPGELGKGGKWRRI